MHSGTSDLKMDNSVEDIALQITDSAFEIENV